MTTTPIQRRAAKFLVMLAILASAPVHTWGSEGVLPAPVNSSTSSREVFTARLVVTDQPDEFLAAWRHPPSADYRPIIPLAHRVKRGSTVMVSFIIANCIANLDGNCDVDADLRVVDSNGVVVGKAPNLAVWKEKTPPEGMLFLGKSYLEIELGGTTGIHRIEALISDRMAVRRVPLAQTVEVVE